MADLKPGTLEFFAQRSPDRIAIVDASHRLSWRHWNDRANRLAAGFEKVAGVAAGDRVAVRIHNRHEWFEIGAALATLGATMVSIGWRLTPEETRSLLEHSGARAFVFDDDPKTLAAAWQESRGIARISLEPSDEAGVVAYSDLVSTTANQTRSSAGRATTIVYTSGTTGQPKGILRGPETDPARRSARARLAGDLARSLGIGVRDRHLLCAPIYHGAGPGIARMTHFAGATVCMMRKFEAEAALKIIADEKITTTFMVPTMLSRIVQLPESVRRRYDVSSLRMILTGASPVPFALKKRVIAHFGPNCLYESYGSTEVGLATLLVPEEQLRRPGSCGRLLAGVDVLVRNEDGAEVALGEVGEIYLSSPEVVHRYLNVEVDATDISADGYFATGDIGVLDQDRFLYIVDRKKDIIISGGTNLYPAEIEAALREHPAVQDVAVFGVPNEDLGEEVKAVCELIPGKSVTAEELMAFSKRELAGNKRPRSIDLTDELPRSPVGKILKRELRQPYWAATGKNI
ncbi:MAG: class I adenylate-forming enzyme family protein [Planctomycetota bacterium]